MESYSLLRTAESVSPYHPDKLCDRISDAILDAYLSVDPDARVAVETCGGHGQVFIIGEVTSTCPAPDIAAIVRQIAGPSLQTTVKLVQQSSAIAQGVNAGGAGDQGIMIGYATAETPELLPLEVVLARRLNQLIFADHPFDGKTQITLSQPVSNLTQANEPVQVASIVASFQNTSRAELQAIVNQFIQEYHLQPLAGQPSIELYLNPAGDWSQGGFDADTGLTGRKLIVDNYGPRVPIGGGCFSGKDPSKVDRSAAYMARRIAVDYLRAYRAQEVFVRLAYAIGYDQPLEHTVIIDGNPAQIPLSDHTIPAQSYDLTPQGIINYLQLKRPIYEVAARYGHFGAGFDWDK